jgi:hypothetical protein
MREYYRHFKLGSEDFAYKSNLKVPKGKEYRGKGNILKYIKDVYKNNKEYINNNLNKDAYIGNESTYKAFKRQVLDGVSQNPTIADLKKSIRRLANSKVLIPESFGEARRYIVKSRNFTSKLKGGDWGKFKNISGLKSKTKFNLLDLKYQGAFDGQGSALYIYGDEGEDKDGNQINPNAVYVIERKSPKKDTGASIEIYTFKEYKEEKNKLKLEKLREGF